MAGGSKKRKRSKKVDNTDSNVDLTLINGYKCLPILKHIVTYSANDEGDDEKNPNSIVKIRSCLYYRRHFGKRLKQTYGDDNNNLVPRGTIEVENNQRNTIFVANLCQRMDETSIKTLFSIDGIQVVDVGIGILDNIKAEPF